MNNEALMNFVYGRPVRPEEFLGREADLLTIFSRLKNKESTAIVGEPHIGKTSLLLLIANQETQKTFLKDDAKKMVVFFKDLQPISAGYTPSEFWKEAIEPLQDRPGHSSIASRLKDVKEQDYSNNTLRKLFQNMGERGQVLVLLLDEFDRLLSHPNFKDPSFFAGMRSLSTITGGLVVITSSRLSVAEMNVKGHELLGGNVNTSPFFNNFIQVKLRPFTSETVTKLLQRVPDVFTSQEITFIRRVAGGHPFLLQAMAATLFETPKSLERPIQAAEMFYSRINFHFDTLWNALDDKAKTTAVILSLMDLDGYSAGSTFSYGEIENANAFDAELKSLSDLGLAEKIQDGQRIDIKHGLIWKGEKWTIGAQAFTWWVRDVVISKSHSLKEYDQWLADKRYRLLLTDEQWSNLTKIVKSVPEFVTKGVSALAKSIVKEIAGVK